MGPGSGTGRPPWTWPRTASNIQLNCNIRQGHFIRLKLTRSGRTVSDNFYLRGLEEYNFKAIRDLPKANVIVKTERQGSAIGMTTN